MCLLHLLVHSCSTCSIGKSSSNSVSKAAPWTLTHRPHPQRAPALIAPPSHTRSSPSRCAPQLLYVSAFGHWQASKELTKVGELTRQCMSPFGTPRLLLGCCQCGTCACMRMCCPPCLCSTARLRCKQALHISLGDLSSVRGFQPSLALCVASACAAALRPASTRPAAACIGAGFRGAPEGVTPGGV